MSTTKAAEARAPLRERGQARVAAIMEAGAALFREKGFDAVTMSDIAARSDTAFGSLYRFFPSKEALADALLQQYAQQTLDGLRELAGRAARAAPRAVAGELVDFMLGLQLRRSFAVTVIEARGGSGEKRAKFRAATRDAVAAILRAALPHLTPARSRAGAIAVLHVLKGVAATDEDSAPARRLVLAEYREMLGAYLSALEIPAAAEGDDARPRIDEAPG